jgi:phosphate-selective porin
LPLSAVVKYDFYDPNVKIAGNNIGLNGSDVGDVSFNTLGFGLLFRANSNIRLQAFYEMLTDDKTSNLADYASDRKDNVFTLRLQYKF